MGVLDYKMIPSARQSTVCLSFRQTLYRLVPPPPPSRTEGSGHSCIHFWCFRNALISVSDIWLKLDVGRITLHA